MAQLTLFEDQNHRNILLEDYATGEMVPSNQHLIIHRGQAMLLDPGGHKIHSKLFADISGMISPNDLKFLFFSHQDPDIIASANFWLMMTNAIAYISELWIRFIPHFGVDRLVINKIKTIPDTGMRLNLGDLTLLIIPAHFMHSPGNFQVYDPYSKTLYSGDLGASLGTDYKIVPDFDSHIQYMEGFHKRYIFSNKLLRLWAKMVRQLPIETIAPQHGAMFKGKKMVERFINWVENLSCGLDLMENVFKLP